MPRELVAATAHDPLGGRRAAVYRQGDAKLAQVPWSVAPEQLSQVAAALPGDRITVDFLTPTRLRLRGRALDRPDFHALVASLTRRAEELASVEAEIDRAAAELWGITDEELAAIQRSLAELHG